MQQGGLLEQPARVRVQALERVQHIQTVPLVIEAKLEEERRQRWAQDREHPRPFGNFDPSRSVTPELADSMKRAGHGSSPSMSGNPHRSFWRSRWKKFRSRSNCTNCTVGPDAISTSAPGGKPTLN